MEIETLKLSKLLDKMDEIANPSAEEELDLSHITDAVKKIVAQALSAVSGLSDKQIRMDVLKVCSPGVT